MFEFATCVKSVLEIVELASDVQMDEFIRHMGKHNLNKNNYSFALKVVTIRTVV